MSQLQHLYGRYLTITQTLVLVLVGVIAAYVHEFVIVIWLAAILFTIYGFVIGEMKWLWYGVAASPTLEVLSRMSHKPAVPHEVGKYFLVMVIGLLFIQHTVRSSNPPAYKIGVLILACLLPSMIVGLSSFNFEDWVLNVFGIAEMALLLIFMARERWEFDKFCRVLQFGLMPGIILLIYLTINTPDFAKLNFTLSSNFKTSGDFGGDQVSTIIGLNIVFAILLLILKRPLFGIKWLNYVMVCLLLFRGFLTFSRGGMIAAILSVFIALLPVIVSSRTAFIRFSIMILLFFGVSVLVFYKVNELTGNQLVLRYQGETAGTLAGTKERNLNTITSYRLEIAKTDWGIFQDNMIFGVGPGQSKDLRPQYGFQAIASHTEYTRLLSEHGLGGLIIIFLLVGFPVWWVSKQKLNIWKAVSGALFAIALLTCLHSAMRTNTTVVCYVLAAVPVYFLKKNNKGSALG